MKALLWYGLAPAAVLIAFSLVYRAADAPDRPRPLVQTTRDVSHPSTCVDCHSDIVESWQASPHANTLRRPSRELVSRFAGRSIEAGGATYRYELEHGKLWFHSSKRDSPLDVDWFFGSGTHELTPVSMLDGLQGDTELVQLHISWFAGDRLDTTPGSGSIIEGSTSLGLHHRAHEARECFECHAWMVPAEEGKLDLEKVQGGVGCRRCHQGAASHAAADGEPPTRPDWHSLSAREAVDRCGECHRRADQFTADELRPENTMLIRFAPVGTVLSPCFRANEDSRFAGRLPRLDCITCHDPHQAASRDPAFYASRCIACHDVDRHGLANCSVEPQSDRCVECHMPKVEVRDQLLLTDHWIRVRK